jgi:NAD(P)-dependent dehydrogenase (short-subunit alcohol dehydrogenase family)
VKGLAVVTGGSKGIGRAVAARLVEAGHPVLITGRDKKALDEAAAKLAEGGGGAEVAAFDVTDEAAVERALAGLPVEILVSNAGYGSSAPLERLALADWRAMLDVHATGAFLCTRAVLGGMRERGRGRIVYMASVAGLAGSRYIAAYTAAKHALVGLMRAVAAEVAGSGITANAVCPGYVDTPMTDASVANIAKVSGRSAEEARAALERTSPLGRFVSPEEVAAAVAWLVSDEGAAVNGQAIIIDGGGLQQ